MIPYLREDINTGLENNKSKQQEIVQKEQIIREKYKKNNKVNVEYKYNCDKYKENSIFQPLIKISNPQFNKSNCRDKISNVFKCIVHFSILFIILNIWYNKSASDYSSDRRLGLVKRMCVNKFPFNYVNAEVTVAIEDGEEDEAQPYDESHIKYELREEGSPSDLALLENVSIPSAYEGVSLLVLDTEGLTYRTDYSKKLIWATRLTEDLLRVKKPVSTRHEKCAIEDIVTDNMDKKKTIGHQIFIESNHNGAEIKVDGGSTSSTNSDRYERLKSHLIPSYDGYVYYVDDFNTKLLQVHVKDIVNYTPFYTPLLEGVYLEGSRNSLVIALDYETGTYITRHNRDSDSKNNYVLNYFVKDKANEQLHIALTNWSVKAYTEKDHTQIWEFDWLEVGSVMNQNKDEKIVNQIRNTITVSSNRLYFNHDMLKPNKPKIDHLAFPFQISAIFAITKTHREGIYTVELLDRLHIPPPPNFLYDSSVTSVLASSRKITHKSLYVENGVIGVLDDTKLVSMVDENNPKPKKIITNKEMSKRMANNNRLLLEDGNSKVKGEGVSRSNQSIGIGVDEKGIIMIGSSVISNKGNVGMKESSYDFLLNWWWLLIFWVIAVVVLGVRYLIRPIKLLLTFVKAKLILKKSKPLVDSTSSRTDIYDSKTDLYDSTDESSMESNIEDTREVFQNIEEDYSEFSVDGRLTINDRYGEEVSNEIRRVKSEGNFDYSIADDYTESVWMEEQSIINVVTNNRYDLSKRSNKLTSMMTINYPSSSKGGKLGTKNTTGSTKEQTNTVTSSPNNTTNRTVADILEPSKPGVGLKEEERDKRDEKKELSVIPSNSILSRFLENGRFLRTFECIKMLGKGGFGSVYRARHKLEPGNPIYAIKFVLLKLRSSEDLSSRRYFREVAANRDIYSKYVVRYYTWWCEEPHFLPLAQMSNQLQMAAINNIRYLVQNGIIPSELINPNEPTINHENTQNADKNKVLNNYIKEYRDIIYQYIQNPEQDDLFPNFSQIAQKNKNNNNIKFLSSINMNKDNSNNDVDLYSENSNILFKDTNTTGNYNETKENMSDKPGDKKDRMADNRNAFMAKMDQFKKKLSIINEYDSKLNDNKQYQVVLLILMEMCNGLTLREWLNKPDRSKDNRKVELVLFKQIIKGLRDIHRNCFIHRDLKPENIFVDDKNNLKIGDLGLVGFIQENHSNSYQPVNTAKQHLLSDATQVSVRGQVIGTPGYTAPEGGGNCTEKVDIYSAALILLELLCPKFNTVMERLETLERFRKNHEVPPFIKERYNPWYELMVKMGDANPENRPSADQVYRQLKVILSPP